MKKTTLINSELSYVISKMGHKDTITISDAGLPIPANTQRIDLAISKNLPSFIDVLTVTLTELYIEKIILAEEIKDIKNGNYEKIIDIINNLSDEIGKDIEVEFVSHNNFKKYTEISKAVVRTGETIPYSNIILVSGVTF